MKFEITKEQIGAITKAFFDINAPVQLYSGVVDLLNKLPEIKEAEVSEEK